MRRAHRRLGPVAGVAGVSTARGAGDFESRAQRLDKTRRTASAASAVAIARYRINLEGLVALCKRRGFVFPSGEVRKANPEPSLGRAFQIYGGYNGFFDYGPLGAELKNNLKKLWWRRRV